VRSKRKKKIIKMFFRKGRIDLFDVCTKKSGEAFLKNKEIIILG